MKLQSELFPKQQIHWPQSGRVILAQYDDESIVVYQAYRPLIGRFAASHGYFGGAFKLTRMSWIKPNFLWMMYRCGWAEKPDQEVVLAVRILRTAFDKILSQAVYSSYQPQSYSDRASWQAAVAKSDVRLQWDPDHSPVGDKLERRAIQLGLRGGVLAKYARDWIVDIEDISDFVREQRQHAFGGVEQLRTPMERVYPVADASVAAYLGLGHGVVA